MKKPTPKQKPKREVEPLSAPLAWLKTKEQQLRKEYDRTGDPETSREHAKILDRIVRLQKVASAADIEMGSALPVAKFRELWVRTLGEFRTTLEDVPIRAATAALFAKLDPADVQEYLQGEMDRAVAQLHEITLALEEEPL